MKSFPASASGFETEAELSIHALDLRLSTHEIALPYGSRPEDIARASCARTGTARRILWTIARMYYALHPLRVLGSLAGALTAAVAD